MQNEYEIIGKNACDVCGTEVDTVDNKVGCPVCEDRYFGKIKESYDQTLKRYNIVSRDLSKLYFDLSEESVKSSYKITTQYLEMEKNLRVYNPSWYYLLTSYQFLRNRFLGNTMQSVNMLYSNFTDVWKASLSTMSENIVSILESMNRFCNIFNETRNVTEKPSLSEKDENLIKTISDVNRMYGTYLKEVKAIKANNSENVTRVLKKK
jgi:uncharacterized Zn finger protein (UPF0148 family)